MSDEGDFSSDLQGYQRELMDEYIEQLGTKTLMLKGDTPTGRAFIEYLIARMYFYNVPVQETTGHIRKKYEVNKAGSWVKIVEKGI